MSGRLSQSPDGQRHLLPGWQVQESSALRLSRETRIRAYGNCKERSTPPPSLRVTASLSATSVAVPAHAEKAPRLAAKKKHCDSRSLTASALGSTWAADGPADGPLPPKRPRSRSAFSIPALPAQKGRANGEAPLPSCPLLSRPFLSFFVDGFQVLVNFSADCSAHTLQRPTKAAWLCCPCFAPPLWVMSSA